MRVRGRAYLVLALCLSGLGSAVGQGRAEQSQRVIVSLDGPTDSLGETVYELQGKHPDAKVVPGSLTPPKVLSQTEPQFSDALRKAKYQGKVTIVFVVSAAGKPLDLKPDPADDPEAVRCAMFAVQQYKFAPAKLDGVPVATRLRVIVEFRRKKWLW